MLRKFFEGLVFGAGFSLAFVAIAWLAVSLLLPVTFPSVETTRVDKDGPQQAQLAQESVLKFHDLPVEEQIKQASVIALARYEPASDGKMKAILKEFLKKYPKTTIYYAIGDEYPSASYYPNESTNYGDGVVLFFVGSPAQMRMSTTYSGDRIRGLGDIPLALFRKKCEAPDA